MNKLVLELLADSNGLLKAMEQSQKSINAFIKGSESAGQSLGGGVNKALDSFMGLSKGGAIAAGVLAGAIVAAGVAATSFSVAAGHQAEELTQLSSVMGMGTDSLQQYDVLLNRVGLGGQDLSLVMKTLSAKMEEAKSGTGAAADRFRQLGIDITKVTGTDDLIRKIADSVSKFSGGTEKAAIMGDLLGKTGLKFIPAFEGGAAAIDEAAAASLRLGATLSAHQVAVLGKMDDSVDDLGLAWKRFSQQLGAFFAPAVDLAAQALTKLLSWGSHVLQELGTASATLSIRFTAMAHAFMEVAAQVFSADVFNGEAWGKTLENIKRIDAEAAAAIEKRRKLNSIASEPDTRAKAPDLIDSAKVQAQAIALADAQQRFVDSLFKNEESIAQARLANFQANLESQKAGALDMDVEISKAHEAALERNAAFTVENIERQIRNYSTYYAEKSALFGKDEKSIAEKTKFEVESNQKIVELLTQLEVAQIKADTTRVQSAMRTAEAIRAREVQTLEDVQAAAQASFTLQQAWYAQAPGLIGQADEARLKGMALIEAEGDLRALKIQQTISDEDRRNEAIYNLDLDLHAKRIALISQFPTFWEQQLQAVVASNAFSISSITSSFNSATAQWLQGKGTFDEFLLQSQTTLITSGLQATEQWLAQLALSHLRELGMIETQEAAKTALKLTGDAARLTATTTTDAAIVATDTAAATASSTVWMASLDTVWGGIVLLGGAVEAFFVETLWPMIVSFATSVIGVLEAIATALGISALFGNIGGVIAAGVLLSAIAGITASLAMGAFANGGIVTGPTVGLMGEAGSPEAAIPLNDRGAAFMQKTMGLAGGGGMMQIVFESDGRQDAEYVMRYMPKDHRLRKRGY